MSATLTGISTIRACKASDRLALEFDNLQNVHSGVWQILMSVNSGECCKAINSEHGKNSHESNEKNKRKNFSTFFFPSLLYVRCVCLIAALGLWLDCVSCAFVACVCFSFIILSQANTTSSNIGLAISQALILTGMVQYGIREMMESFQFFTNTERVLQYTKLEQEPLISRKPTRDWPFKGTSVEHFNLISSYRISFSVYFSSLHSWTHSSRFD